MATSLAPKSTVVVVVPPAITAAHSPPQAARLNVRFNTDAVAARRLFFITCRRDSIAVNFS
ncbi:MAG: hypothetical protein MET45_21355 [Nostoc sp. LLA-1]|nr:hypothetical protein [Cyanocohniella sp. LLY]